MTEIKDKPLDLTLCQGWHCIDFDGTLIAFAYKEDAARVLRDFNSIGLAGHDTMRIFSRAVSQRDRDCCPPLIPAGTANIDVQPPPPFDFEAFLKRANQD